jgi:AcrR family transcriptional regulator
MALSAQKKKGNRERRRTDIRDRLLEAIEKLAANGESYANVTIERLATTAGLSRATFYIYFEGKGDLLRVSFDEALQGLGAACSPWLALGAKSSQADLRAALAQIIETYRAQASLMAAVADEATQDSSLRDELSAAIQRGADALRAQIERGQGEGWIDRDLLPGETAAWAIWMLERGLTQVVPHASDDTVAALIDTLADMAWHTLYVGSR